MFLKTLTATSILLVACSALAQPASPLRVGVIGPFSGGSADFGVPMLNGVKLAVDEINAVGGYLGRRLELVVKDDAGDPDTGAARSNELVAEKVTATLGFCNTGVAMKALDTFQQNKVPLIVPCATGSPITAKYPAPQSYVFRTSARDAIQAPFIVGDVLKRGWNKVAIFADTTGYGEAGLQDVRRALSARSIEPVHVARFQLGVTDLGQELAAAKAAGANVVLSYTMGPENAVIANGRKRMGWSVPQVGAWPLSFPSYVEGSAAAEGSLMAQTFIAEPSNERRAAFVSAYARKFNVTRIPVPMAAAQAYDATYLLLYGLSGIRDGNLNGPAVKASLENIQRVYYGVVATYEKPFSLDDKDALTQNMLVMSLVKNRAITFAYADDAKRNLFVQRKTKRARAQVNRSGQTLISGVTEAV